MALRTDKDFLCNSKGEVTPEAVGAFTTRLDNYAVQTAKLPFLGKLYHSLRHAVSFFY